MAFLRVLTTTNVIPLFHRKAVGTWKAFFISSSAEQLEELAWAAQRKGSGCRGKFPATDINEEVLQLPGAFRAALSKFELTNLEFYENSYPCGCVYKLNQNPAKNRGVASGKEVLHCIIKNTQIDWSSEHARWMVASELLTAQGFPVRCELVGPFRETGHRPGLPEALCLD